MLVTSINVCYNTSLFGAYKDLSTHVELPRQENPAITEIDITL